MIIEEKAVYTLQKEFLYSYTTHVVTRVARTLGLTIINYVITLFVNGLYWWG